MLNRMLSVHLLLKEMNFILPQLGLVLSAAFVTFHTTYTLKFFSLHLLILCYL